MEPIRVCVDIDSVCANINIAWTQLYNKDYNDTLKPEDITDWDVAKFVHPDCGKKIYDYLRHPEFYKLTPPVEGFKDGILNLKEEGFEVVYVSAFERGCADTKVEWMYEYAPNFDLRKELFLCFPKQRVLGDVLLDDGPHNLRDAIMRTVRFIMPYNKGVEANAHTSGWDAGEACVMQGDGYLRVHSGIVGKVYQALSTERYHID